MIVFQNTKIFNLFGKVIACDKKNNLLKLLDNKELIIEFSEKVNSLPQKINKFVVLKEEKKVVLRFKKSQINTAEIINAFVEKKFKLKEITTKESDLEDIFIKLLKN